MNTRINYHYRDAGNYRTSGSWIVTGAYTPEQETALRAACLDEEDCFFVPTAVGIPMLEFSNGWDEQSDHALCTLGDLEPTMELAQDARTIDQLEAAFAARDWEADGAAFALAKAAW